jgi:hypothetical protein
VAHGVATNVEPLAATEGVPPSLGMCTLGILAKEKVATPSGIVAVKLGPRDSGSATTVELIGSTWTTKGTLNLHHWKFFLRASVSNTRGSCLVNQPAGV